MTQSVVLKEKDKSLIYLNTYTKSDNIVKAIELENALQAIEMIQDLAENEPECFFNVYENLMELAKNAKLLTVIDMLNLYQGKEEYSIMARSHSSSEENKESIEVNLYETDNIFNGVVSKKKNQIATIPIHNGQESQEKIKKSSSLLASKDFLNDESTNSDVVSKMNRLASGISISNGQEKLENRSKTSSLLVSKGGLNDEDMNVGSLQRTKKFSVQKHMSSPENIYQRNNSSTKIYNSPIVNKKKAQSCHSSVSSADAEGHRDLHATLSETSPYLRHIREILKEKNGDEVLTFSYPLFADEITLFATLLKLDMKYQKAVKTFLTTLVLQSFPNGTDGIVAASYKIDKLMQYFQFEIPHLQEIAKERYILLPNSKKSASDQVVNNSLLDSHFLQYGAANIAHVWKGRDIELIQAVSLRDLKHFLESNEKSSNSVTNVVRVFDQTVRWIVYEIASNTDFCKRSEVVDRFQEIAALFFEKGNFHGIMQISQALSMAKAKELLSSERMKNKKITDLINLSEEKEGLHYNYNYISTSGRQDNCIPSFPAFLSNMQLLFDKCNENRKFNEYLGSLKTLSKLVMHFRKLQKIKFDRDYLETNGFADSYHFLCGLPHIEQDFLDAYSLLSKNSEMVDELPKQLSGWTTSHLISEFRKAGGKDEALAILFLQGVYNGRDLKSKLQSDTDWLKNQSGVPKEFLGAMSLFNS